jgi:Integrase core domain
VLLCDPHHPPQHGFGERSHRTLNQECLRLHRPKTLDEVRQVTEALAAHSNWQRPHQGISCGNRPPRVAFPDLPALPPVPDLVHPDAWLSRVTGKYVVRRVTRHGLVKVDVSPDSIASKLAGQAVTFSVHAQEQSLQVVSPQEYHRSLPLKGLQQRALSYQE